MKFFENKGTTLVEVMVAAGISGVVLMGVVSTIQMQSKHSREFEQRIDISTLRRNINAYFLNTQACKNTLQPLGDLSSVTSTNSSTHKNFNNIRDGLNNVKYKANTVIENNYLSFGQFKVTDYDSTKGIEVSIPITRIGAGGVPNQTVTETFYVSTTLDGGGVVTDCTGSSDTIQASTDKACRALGGTMVNLPAPSTDVVCNLINLNSANHITAGIPGSITSRGNIIAENSTNANTQRVLLLPGNPPKIQFGTTGRVGVIDNLATVYDKLDVGTGGTSSRQVSLIPASTPRIEFQTSGIMKQLSKVVSGSVNFSSCDTCTGNIYVNPNNSLPQITFGAAGKINNLAVLRDSIAVGDGGNARILINKGTSPSIIFETTTSSQIQLRGQGTLTFGSNGLINMGSNGRILKLKNINDPTDSTLQINSAVQIGSAAGYRNLTVQGQASFGNTNVYGGFAATNGRFQDIWVGNGTYVNYLRVNYIDIEFREISRYSSGEDVTYHTNAVMCALGRVEVGGGDKPAKKGCKITREGTKSWALRVYNSQTMINSGNQPTYCSMWCIKNTPAPANPW